MTNPLDQLTEDAIYDTFKAAFLKTSEDCMAGKWKELEHLRHGISWQPIEAKNELALLARARKAIERLCLEYPQIEETIYLTGGKVYVSIYWPNPYY